ncbi:MAG: hypothetical protein K5634_00925 [Sphaerochaetaceae bacterium]|nr:hypothetical protein [Sphaerochaetaceae bacterium]
MGLSIVAVLALVVLAMYDVFSGEMRSGKYIDPQVAEKTVEGTIYDREGRALAIEVPVYEIYINLEKIDNTQLELLAQTIGLYTGESMASILAKCNQSESMLVYISSVEDESEYLRIMDAVSSYSLEGFVQTKKGSERIYPAQFHMAQLILEVEDVFYDVLNPRPAFDSQITYGNDISLTLDLDIQYFSDLAVQKVYSLQNPELAVCFIYDCNTSRILGLSTYPFYDINTTSTGMKNYAYLSSFTYEGKQYNASVIMDSELSGQFNSAHQDTQFIKDLFSKYSEKHSSCIVRKVKGSSSEYILFVASLNPRINTGKEAVEEAVKIIEDGLVAQSKI